MVCILPRFQLIIGDNIRYEKFLIRIKLQNMHELIGKKTQLLAYEGVGEFEATHIHSMTYTYSSIHLRFCVSIPHV